MAPRTVGALALRPTGNAQGGYYFFNLNSGRIINRNRATRVPMPNEVIERVDLLAHRQEVNPGLVFGDREDVPDPQQVAELPHDDHDSDDDSYDPDGSDSEDSDDDLEEDEDDVSEGELSEEDENYHNANANNHHGGWDGNDNRNDENDRNDGEDEEDGMNAPGAEQEDEHPEEETIEFAPENAPEMAVDEPLFHNYENDDNEPVAPIDHEHAVAQDMDQRYGERGDRYTLRPRREPSFAPRYTMVTGATTGKSTGVTTNSVTSAGVGPAIRMTGVDNNENMEGTLMTPQMSLKQGLKRFADAGLAAVKKEVAQLHFRQVMKARKRNELTHLQRKRALGYLMFLKRKRNGTVKARGCADGRPQREYTRKEDASSPTVANESVFITAVIDGAEDREVAVVDVPGAFMQAEMDEIVHLRLTGVMVDMLLETDSQMYEPFVCYEGRTKVIYVELLKALYGTLRAARLFWMTLTEKLESWGFTPNPYDPCVANKIVNGKQLTVAWHVDDLKISHVDALVVDAFIGQMRDAFGKETPLSESRGKTHDFLGMTLDYTTPGCVRVGMVDYVKGMIEGMPPDMIGTAPTPASSSLFKTNDTAAKLDNERKEIYVHLVMQGLYLSQRARPDIRTAISFLCSRTKAPDEDDYKKLIRLMQYLQGTTDMTLKLDGDDIGKPQWWVDASYAVHDDAKGHTGGTLSLGRGAVYSTSTKQKLVSRSSTESEVIGVHDVLPQIVWTSEFIKSQGYRVDKTVLYQDNMSAMLMEQNDLVNRGDITVEHCPTEQMVADYFTKPLQGRLFYKIRDKIMNIDPTDNYHSDHRSVLRKCENKKMTDGQASGSGTTRYTALQIQQKDEIDDSS
eukprot:Nitzschia sp. Nitz4//scaffold489_size5144//31//2646//NITZ4_009230-RA/size5144-processed-gene-0.1-mRNA-1//1//CDS//3329552897//2602//frame0